MRVCCTRALLSASRVKSKWPRRRLPREGDQWVLPGSRGGGGTLQPLSAAPAWLQMAVPGAQAPEVGRVEEPSQVSTGRGTGS